MFDLSVFSNSVFIFFTQMAIRQIKIIVNAKPMVIIINKNNSFICLSLFSCPQWGHEKSLLKIKTPLSLDDEAVLVNVHILHEFLSWIYKSFYSFLLISQLYLFLFQENLVIVILLISPYSIP